ncbi:MAG: hypothetical protein M1423_01850 [Acidobacteria bacterium]|nr:hypothetical protein [Acidobacteriota bacterium]
MISGSPLYRPYEGLVEISILGKSFQVPEKNTCLRAFQFVAPESIPYGRFCWNQECQLCRIGYTMEMGPKPAVHPVLACKILVAHGMKIVELSDELKLSLGPILKNRRL